MYAQWKTSCNFTNCDGNQGWKHASASLRNWTQNEFHCCGFYNSSDCAPAVNDSCNCPGGNTQLPGCMTALVDEIREKMLIVAISVLAVGALQIFVLCFSGCLLCYLPTNSQQEYEPLTINKYYVS